MHRRAAGWRHAARRMHERRRLRRRGVRRFGTRLVLLVSCERGLLGDRVVRAELRPWTRVPAPYRVVRMRLRRPRRLPRVRHCPRDGSVAAGRSSRTLQHQCSRQRRLTPPATLMEETGSSRPRGAPARRTRHGSGAGGTQAPYAF
jgi:hypothetical protein